MSETPTRLPWSQSIGCLCGYSTLAGDGSRKKAKEEEKGLLQIWAEGKHEESMYDGKEKVRKPPHQPCLVHFWVTTIDWLQIPEQPAVQLFTACLHASLLLWSWLPFLSYFCRRNLISRHTSPTTAIGVDYKTFIATCLGTAQKRGPEIVHK